MEKGKIQISEIDNNTITECATKMYALHIFSVEIKLFDLQFIN